MTRHSRIVLGIAAVLLASASARADSPALAAAKLCRKTISIQGRTYVKKRMGYILVCADKLLKCELLDEIDGINPNSCRSSARDSCTAKIGPASDSTLNKAAAKFDAKAGLACLGMPFANVLSSGMGGLWYASDATCGASADLPTLLQCVRGEVEARSDALASELKPRSALLLDNIGLGDGFPNLTRPPFDDVLVSATAPGSGTLVSPGTINVTSGHALRFTGDGATLPCGNNPGQTGKLTITVGDQELQLKEPYGSGDVAVFGPYTASGDIAYTIDLKDGSCMDTITGNVHVP